MIVRILEDGQYELDESNAAQLSKLDAVLSDAVANGDNETFAAALRAAIDAVHAGGRRIAPSEIVTSDLALPTPGSSLDEVRRLLDENSADPDGAS